MTETTATAGEPARAAEVRRRPGARWLRSRWWRWGARAGMTVALAGCVVAFRDRLPSPGALWRVATHAHPGWFVVVIVGQLASMDAFARVQRRLVRAGGGRMSLRRALRVTYAGNALSTTLPVGPAVSVAFGFRQFRRAGASPRHATAVIALGGVIMTTAYSLVALAALVAEPWSRAFALEALATLVICAGAGMAVWSLRPAPLARLARRAVRPLLAHRLAAPVAELFDGRGALRLGPRDWAALSVLALVNWLADIASLDAAGRAVGLHAALYGVALAYFAAQAAGSLFPLLPGGLGAIEGSLTASLMAFGALAVPAGAAVALYRLVSFWGVVGAGWLAWLVTKLGDEAPDGRVRGRLRAGAPPFPSFVAVPPPREPSPDRTEAA